MSFDISSIFSQGKQQRVLGVSLTPGIGLEAVMLDKANLQVLAYGKRDVAYNFSLREIQDMSQFKVELASLVAEMRVPDKTPIYFVLPNVLFDFMEYPADIAQEGLETMILSKAEEFYLFKKEEPQSGWCEIESKEAEASNQKKIVYTSFQKSTVEMIKTAVEEMKMRLVGVESAFSATLRGLFLTGQLEDILLEESRWTMMLISTNSYTLFQMNSDKLISYNEVPLALKSFSAEEAYQAIVSSSSQILSNYESSRLFIVSQTDDISADVLKRELRFDKDIIAINSNKFSKEPILPVLSTSDYESARFLTLSAIGAACSRCEFNLCINVMQNDPSVSTGLYKIALNGKTYEISSYDVIKYVVIASVIIFVVFGSLIGTFFALKSSCESELNSINDEISKKQEMIDAYSNVEEAKPEVDVTDIIDAIANMNISAINFYDSNSSDIPKNIWLTKYYNHSGDKIVIKGIAENIVDVYEYYKNLKILSPQSDIKLAELKIITSNGEGGDNGSTENDPLKGLNIDTDSSRLYSFEISNTSIGNIESEAANNSNGGLGDNVNLIRRAPNVQLEEVSSQMEATN